MYLMQLPVHLTARYMMTAPVVDVASVRYEGLWFVRLCFDYEAIDKPVSNINYISIVEKTHRT
jgi:hypothetical protein